MRCNEKVFSNLIFTPYCAIDSELFEFELFEECSTKISQKQIKKSSVLDGFDKKTFPNKPSIINNMIAVVQPELKPESRDKIAKQMATLEKHKVEPRCMVAIIDTESNFFSSKVSSTGDLSVAQINPDVWNRDSW